MPLDPPEPQLPVAKRRRLSYKTTCTPETYGPTNESTAVGAAQPAAQKDMHADKNEGVERLVVLFWLLGRGSSFQTRTGWDTAE